MKAVMPEWLKYITFLVAGIAGALLGSVHLPFLVLIPLSMITGFTIYWMFYSAYSVYWEFYVAKDDTKS